MPHYMTNENYHCLDINYRTEFELKAISTYLFIFIMLSTFFYFQINRFMTEEIRHLNRELTMIREQLSFTSDNSDGSDGNNDSDDNDGSGSSEDESSSCEESETSYKIKLRGKSYIMS
mgnify:CR=1 FL=1